MLLGLMVWTLATGAALTWVVKSNILTAERNFADYGEYFHTHIRDKLRANEAVLYGFSTVLGAIDRDDQEAASQYARQMLERYPHVYMLEIVRRVTRREFAELTALIDRKWHKGFQIRQFDYDDSRRWRPAAIKDAYYPVILAEPTLPPEQSIIGLDIDSLEGLRAALIQSERQGTPVASRPFRLVEGDTAYVLFRPVASITAQPVRKTSIVGDSSYALMVIRAKDLFPYSTHLNPAITHTVTMHVGSIAYPLLSVEARQTPQLGDSFFQPLRIERAITDSAQPLLLTLEQRIGLRDIAGTGLAAVSLASILSLALLLGYCRSRRQHEWLLRQERQTMEHMALHDPLTALPNRFLMLGRLEQALTTAHRHGSQLAILFLDLDGFKPINDTHGHHVGDELLKTIAQRLRECIRDCDTVARHGGDEFVVALTDIRDPGDAAAVADKILETIARPATIEGIEVAVTTSIGIAIYPDNGKHSKALLRAADAAMYEAKAEGRRIYRFAAPEASKPANAPA
ncbi:MAG: sensor domain-containing diguanylate cyclase [Zoogloeaceae bacterium]|nr:sensor domain-containing diguanylate cyclase [Zoogloeaceae bacterium]